MIRTSIMLLAAALLVTPVAADSGRSKVEFARAGVVCLPIAPATGVSTSGLTLGIIRYDPGNTSASIRVSLLDKADGFTKLLGRVSVFPAEPFTGTPDDPERKFSMSLRQHAELVEGLDEICMRVELIDAADNAVSGELQGFLEFNNTH